MIAIDDLRCEGAVNPLGLGELRPRFTWQVEGAVPRAFKVVATAADDGSGLWDSGWSGSTQSATLYDGGPLRSRQRVEWRVEIRAGDGTSAVSDPSSFEMGLLAQDDWDAQWIRWPYPEPPTDRHWPCPYLRAQLDLPGPVVRGRAYVTAVGLYRMFVNGVEVIDEALRPGWTDYNRRIQHQSYDVGHLLRPGANAVGVVLGPGWACGHVGTEGQRQVWAEHPQLLAQIEVELEDGQVVRLHTGPDWQARFGPLLGSDLHVGETYDARREMPGWAEPDADREGWSPVMLAPRPRGRVVPQAGPSVRPMRLVPAAGVWNIGFNRAVADLGQNIVGRVRLTVEAPAGTEIVLHHGEMLNPDGSVYRSNLRRAFAEDRYICRGGGPETYEPSFTVHGFRFVEVWGLPGFIETANITGVVLHSEMEESGHFSSSSSLLNGIDHAIRWSQRGNAMEVPTDCPQRDERLGWMGDATALVGSAAARFDVGPFLAKWLVDLADASERAGHFTDTAPEVGVPRVGSPGWGDAGVLVPCRLIELTGDDRPAARLYPAMVRWLDRIADHNPDHLRINDVGFNWGDWLSWPDDKGTGQSHLLSSVYSGSPPEVLATAYWARMAAVVSPLALRFGRADDAARFAEMNRQVTEAYRRAFVGEDARIHGGTQTVYAQALALGLVADEMRSLVADRLVETIAANDGRMTVGYVGACYLLPALADNGRVDLAYRLLLSSDIPSWGAMVRHGATTIWERWDGWTPDRGFNDVRMNSFNHTGLGAVGEFLITHVAGVRLDLSNLARPSLTVRPQPGPGLDHVSMRWLSPIGPIESSWRRRDGSTTFEVRVPFGAETAALAVAADETRIVGPGHHTWTSKP